MKTERQQKLLEEVRKLLAEEGYRSGQEPDAEELITRYVLPALESSKDIQRHLYTDFTGGGGGIRSLKNKVIKKFANVTRNTVEKSFMRQQKFNDNVLILLRYLLQENEELRRKLAQKNG
jgi:hypothetical protein